MTKPRAVASPDAAVFPEFAELASDERIVTAAATLERNGIRLRLYRMDREMQRREVRTLAASPDYVVGSVHALTEGGSLLIASASGSQLGPLVSGAEHVILVIGGPEDRPRGRNRDAANLRILLPARDARARRATEWPAE